MATSIYLGMIVVVVSVALAVPDLWGLVMALVGIQCCAAIWYAASYVPFGRKMIKSCLMTVARCGQ